MHDTRTTPSTARPGARHPLLLLFLLAAVLLTGGYFRFVGLNWDDFADLHPDERFLTRNLLPLVGGGLEFTHDDKRYPPVSIVVNSVSAYTDRSAITPNNGLRVGALKDTPPAEAARWWVGEARVVLYDTVQSALDALLRDEVAALMVSSETAVSLAGAAREIGSLSSPELQQMRCLALNPQTGGAGGYFDTGCSPLNPHHAGAGFYAYGTLPLFIAHFGSQFMQQQEAAGSPLFDFQGGTLVWRFFSALFDCGTIFLIFLIGTRLHNRWVGLLAALLYAAAPLAIQKAHFGTVNSITTFFVTLGLWAAVRVQQHGHWRHFIIFGLSLGAALSGRINTLPLAGVIVLAAMMYAFPVLDTRLPWQERQRLLTRMSLGIIIAGFLTIFAFRLANPYAFQGPQLWNILPNPRFLEDLGSATFGVSGNSDAPPNYQWLNRSAYLYPLKDMLLWGMGIGMAVLAWFGWGWSGYQLVRAKPGGTRNMLLFVWVLVYFGYMGNQWVMTMRYYLPLYPALALLAAWGVVELVRQARQRGEDLLLTRLLLAGFALTLGLLPVYDVVNTGGLTFTAGAAGLVALLLAGGAFMPGLKPNRAVILGSFVALFTVLWGLMFTHLYRTQVTRVQASRWLWENIPGDFALQLDAAPPGTPLINIGIPNNPVDALNPTEELLQSAVRLRPLQPFLVEFVAPAHGTVTRIFAPRLGDDDGDADEETLYFSIARTGDNTPLTTATLTTDLSRSTHLVGEAYTIPLDTPLQVSAGQRYTFKVEALSGTVRSSGSVVVTEGEWDDRLTTIRICELPYDLTLSDGLTPGLVGQDDCRRLEAWYTLITSYDQAMSYPVDDVLKRDSIIQSLHHGDYITITSNRFYDSEWRNRLRFPLTSYYYEALFRGDLGYDLIAVFDEHFQFGALSVSDQHLPVYTSPAWLNEWESDEAFHVYDHPAVFIFRKRADYDPQRVAFLLNSIPLQQIGQIMPDRPAGAQLVGVVYQGTLEADRAPTGLMLPPDLLALQQAGGTWSERFHSGSLLNQNQPVGVAAWWLTIMLFGWLAFPLLFTLFPSLADRGYSVAKLVGLLLVAWLAWTAASVQIPLWSQGGVALALLALSGLSLALVWRQRADLGAYVRTHWRRLLTIELLTLLLFLAFIGVRLSNPDLWHDFKGGEKPMDFAYFNAVLRSTVFPPYDPWYAGGFINYYYFGFVLVGSPVLLLQIVPAFAYNLIIPTLFALTGIGAFAAAFNIVHAWRERPPWPAAPEAPPRPVGNPWAAGIAALLLCVVVGNLDTIRVMGIGLATLGGYQMPLGMEDWYARQFREDSGLEPTPEQMDFFRQQAARAPFFEKIAYELEHSATLVSSIFTGLVRLSGGATLPVGSDRWYWGPSRVLTEAPGVGGNAITEMPYFTFLYGDLHAHMINLPVILFVIVFVFHEIAAAGQERRSLLARCLALALGALAVGLMEAINTWDWPSFLLFSVIGLGYAWWLHWQRLDRWSLTALVATISGFLCLSFAFAYPYTVWYAATYGSLLPWTEGKTPLWAYFDIHGLFLFLLISLLVWETGRWLRGVKVRALRGQGHWLLLAALSSGVILLAALIATLTGYQVALIVLPLVMWIVPLFFRRGQSRAMQFVLVLAGFALAMTLGVEVIVLGGDIGRQNTVFKFYMQVWLLFSVMGGVAFAWLTRSSDTWSLRLNVLWYSPLLLLFIIAALFPIMATRARALDRMVPELPLTLNGMDYLQSARHGLMDYADVISLANDYAIIRWLQEHVRGTPTIMEGRSLASEYRYNGRIAINTGLPAVLGWNFHQRQQRTFDPLPRLVEMREANIKHFYNTASVLDAVNILRHYDVRYIVVSDMEQVMTLPEGLAKFDAMVSLGLLSIAFEQDGARVYAVDQAALTEYAFASRDEAQP